MKKATKAGGTNRNIRTLSRKDHEVKRNQVAESHTYSNLNNNNSGLFGGGQHDRSNSQVPRGAILTHSKANEFGLPLNSSASNSGQGTL